MTTHNSHTRRDTESAESALFHYEIELSLNVASYIIIAIIIIHRIPMMSAHGLLKSSERWFHFFFLYSTLIRFVACTKWIQLRT